MRHLLQVGGHVRVVAEEVHVVEDDADNVLDPVAKVASTLRLGTGRDGRAADNGHAGCRDHGGGGHSGCYPPAHC